MNHVFLLQQLKNYQEGKKPSRKNCGVGTKLGIDEQKDGAIVQSLKPLLGRPSNFKRKDLNQ